MRTWPLASAVALMHKQHAVQPIVSMHTQTHRHDPRLNDGSNGRRPSSEHLPRLANIVMTTQAAVARTGSINIRPRLNVCRQRGKVKDRTNSADEVFVRALDAGTYKFRETCDFYLVVGGEGTLKPKCQHNT